MWMEKSESMNCVVKIVLLTLPRECSPRERERERERESVLEPW